MTSTVFKHSELELEVGQCLVIHHDGFGPIVIALSNIGTDLEGDTICEFEISCDDEPNLMVGLTNGSAAIGLGNSSLTFNNNHVLDRTASGAVACNGLIRVPYLLQYLVCHKIRVEVFFPSFNELLEDHVAVRLTTKNRFERVILFSAFTFRSSALLFDCIVAETRERWVPIRAFVATLAGAGFFKWLLA